MLRPHGPGGQLQNNCAAAGDRHGGDAVTWMTDTGAYAFGVAFGLEYLDTTVKTPDDVERYLGLPVIGIVPAFQARRR